MGSARKGFNIVATKEMSRVHVNPSPIQYDQIRFQNLELKGGAHKDLFDVYEHGQLIMFEMHATHRLVGLELNIYGQSGAIYKVQDFHHTFETLLQLGYGLAPGDVKLLPDNTSPDPHGTPNPFHPYLTRYKTTTEVDITGQTSTWFSMAFTPAYPVEYQGRLTASVANNARTVAKIRDLIITRYNYVDFIEPQH